MQLLKFLRVQNSGFCRYKQWCTALCKNVCPLTIFLPWDHSENTDTVCINMIKRIVLRKTECQRIYAHSSGTLPDTSAGIVTGPVQMHQACAEMPDGIAANDHCFIAPGSIINLLIKHFYDFCAGFGLIIKMPFLHGIVS